MPGYIYLPVPTQEMLDFARDWTEGQRAKGKTPYTVVHNRYVSGLMKGLMRHTGHGVLRNIAATDKLYILAHGAATGSKRIGGWRGMHFDAGTNDWEGGTLKGYTADQMARALEGEGLIKSFVDLRVFACGSGLVPPPKSGETQSFAERLRTALRGRGYNHVAVTGYLGSVKPAYDLRSVGIDQFTTEQHKGIEVGGRVFVASSQKVTF